MNPRRGRRGVDGPGQWRQAVIYARVSSKEQEREGFSIPAQLRLLRDHALHHGLTVAEEFVDVETAKRSGRAGFGEMVRYLRRRSGGCRVLLVEKTDRLYRNIKDWVTLDDLDLEIHFVKEGTVLSRESRSSEKFMHGIKVLMAKNFIDNLSEEIRKGMREKAEEGMWPSRAPLGYRNTLAASGKRIIEPDPEVAPLIRQLFEWYGTGRYSLQQVAAMARQAGLRSRETGARVPKATIHRTLRNPVYQGDVLWDGRIFPGTHEPLVSRELWATVQEVLLGKPGKHRQTRYEFAFAGLLECGHCGCGLTAEIKKGRYVYYHCTGFRGKCGEPYVREEVLEEQFTALLGGLRLDPEILEWLIATLRVSDAERRKLHDAAIARLQEEHATLQRRLDAMYVDKLDGRIDAGTYDQLATEWRGEQDRLRRSIAEHRQEGEAYFDEGAKLLELASRCQDLFREQPPTEKRKLLGFVLSNCLWKAGQLEPTFRRPFDLLITASNRAQQATTMPAAGGLPDGRLAIWYPQRDSNPRSSP